MRVGVGARVGIRAGEMEESTLLCYGSCFPERELKAKRNVCCLGDISVTIFVPDYSSRESVQVMFCVKRTFSSGKGRFWVNVQTIPTVHPCGTRAEAVCSTCKDRYVCCHGYTHIISDPSLVSKPTKKLGSSSCVLKGPYTAGTPSSDMVVLSALYRAQSSECRSE